MTTADENRKEKDDAAAARETHKATALAKLATCHLQYLHAMAATIVDELDGMTTRDGVVTLGRRKTSALHLSRLAELTAKVTLSEMQQETNSAQAWPVSTQQVSNKLQWDLECLSWLFEGIACCLAPKAEDETPVGALAKLGLRASGDAIGDIFIFSQATHERGGLDFGLFQETSSTAQAMMDYRDWR